MSNFFEDAIYNKSHDNKYRYALGTKGENTLYCFGVNPSTATPEKYDPTVTRVKNIAYKQGFDSFVMLNIYPLRATDPKELPADMNSIEHIRNVETILDLVKNGSVVWAAWGDLINSRHWLAGCRDHIFAMLQDAKRDISWIKMGNLTIKNNPRHPLYLKHQDFSVFKPDKLSG